METHEQIKQAGELVHSLAVQYPGLSVEELLLRINDLEVQFRSQVEDTRRPCKNCGHPVVVSTDGRLKHIHDNGRVSNVGCRAASYDRPGFEGWDDTIADGMNAR